jgi:solute carrier family 25 ornithine transporter 2/15
MMLAGGFAGTALWTAIFPADVVKSRIQVSSIRQLMIVVLL